MQKIYIETVGCPKNQEDSEKMAGLLKKAGHEITMQPEEADVIIINTCGFIEDAKRESIETFFDYVPYKEEGKQLIVTGCLTQRYPDELAAELPEADAILGVNDYEKLPEIISGHCERSEAIQKKSLSVYTNGKPGIFTAPRTALSPRHSSYLKIAEGCSNRCAYCIIPEIRGPYRSVPMELLLEETGELSAEGCKELILIAQDLTSYGRDLYGNYALADLLKKLCESDKTKGIEWIRLLYCYEERVTDDLISVMASEQKILKYIDIPLQHVNDRILKSMRRSSTKESIQKTIAKLRESIPGIVLRTTFITGLPGETEKDFEELYEFASETRFDRLGVFAYSPEEGTDAALMPDQVERETAETRRGLLMRLQQQISQEKNQALIGTVRDVIVDGSEYDEDENRPIFIGRTRGDAPEIDNAVIFEAAPGDDIIGSIVKVYVTDAFDYDLAGVYTKDL